MGYFWTPAAKHSVCAYDLSINKVIKMGFYVIIKVSRWNCEKESAEILFLQIHHFRFNPSLSASQHVALDLNVCLLAHVRSWVTLYEWYPSCADGSRKLGIGCVRTALWGTGDCIINTIIFYHTKVWFLVRRCADVEWISVDTDIIAKE